MHKYLFKSRMGALAFAALVVIGALALVGGGEEPGTLVATSDGIADRRAEFVHRMDEENAAVDNVDGRAQSEESEADWDDQDEFVDDEELVDSATGYDPTPAGEGAQDSGALATE